MSTIVTNHLHLKVLTGAVAVMLPLFCFAADSQELDRQFDKTGDKLVDAADWSKMTAAEKAQYAKASVEALGEDADTLLPDGHSRAEHYLKGLNLVYHK